MCGVKEKGGKAKPQYVGVGTRRMETGKWWRRFWMCAWCRSLLLDVSRCHLDLQVQPEPL